MRMIRQLVLLASAAVSMARPAAAQESAWGENGYISLSGMYEATSMSISAR